MLDKLREMSKNVLRKVLMRGDDQISFIFTFYSATITFKLQRNSNLIQDSGTGTCNLSAIANVLTVKLAGDLSSVRLPAMLFFVSSTNFN